jgi:23S rRNA pseudouridine2605 synthase
VGHKVLKLRRVQIGPIKLGELPVGAHRPLSADELSKLRDYAFGSRLKKKAKPADSTGPLSARKKYVGAKPPRVEETDRASDEDSFDSGPVLVNEELTHFDDRSTVKNEFRTRHAGAVIASGDDDLPAPKPTGRTTESREQRARPKKRFGKPGKKFAKASSRTAQSDRPAFAKHKPAKKKFARPKGRR